MNWMQTYTGRSFYPTHPDPEEVDPVDISHALSLLCRYNGHVNRFYSVAEHCVLMSQAVAPEHALWALLHDATEAYVGDMIRPLKQQIPAYVDVEKDVMVAICTRFGLDQIEPFEVKEADARILVDERNALMKAPPKPWFNGEQVEPLGVRVSGWAPLVAEVAWLERFDVLYWGRPQ